MSDQAASRQGNLTQENSHATDQSPPSSVVGKMSTSKSATEVDELLRADAGDIDATTVSMDRSGAEQITAQRVTMDRSGAKSMETRSAQLTDSGVASLKSEHAVLQGSAAVLVAAAEARVVKSRALAIVAGTLNAEEDVKTVLYIGPAERGIRTVLTVPSALGLGVGFGIAVLVVGRLFKSIFRGR